MTPGGRAPFAPSVAINARAAVRARIGGVERHALELSRLLPALRPERYRVIAPRPALAHRAGHAWEQAILPLRARDCPLVYSPANLAPIAHPGNVIVIHDLAALRCPDGYSRAYVAYQRAVLPRLARRARLVLTVSEFSRRELSTVLGVAPERIQVVPGGVDERFASAADPARAGAPYGLRGRYVLAVATDSPRKNLGILELAAQTLRREGIELVLAGAGRSYMRASAAPLRRLGYVADADLPGIYAGATAFVMPSRYEGLGLPCLEAMASGVPVVAARAGALPETVGDAALLVDPDDARAFASTLRSVCDDGELRRRLIAAGHARAATRTWTRCAERTDAAIAGLLKEDRG